MNLLAREAAPGRESAPTHWFGQGAQEPYAKAMRDGRGTLILEPQTVESAVTAIHYRVEQWCEQASPAEVSMLLASRGPVLDAGCGPGRMLEAAESIGRRALGVDVSSEAVAHARARGMKALHQSIFEPVPHEGVWGTALLLDGNIGIGGSVPALLRRMDQVLSPTGSILIEVDVLDSLDVSYLAVLRGQGAETSEPFAWARVGSQALQHHAGSTGWQVAKWLKLGAGVHSGELLASRPVQERVVCLLVRRR